jgi:L-amino acid N-acyltransferase YncA
VAYTFEKLKSEHRDGVLEIFNYYIRTATSAFREQVVEKDYFQNFLQLGETHPIYAIKAEGGRIIGFCMLKPHIPLSTFAEAAELMYFIDHEYTGRGIGSLALQRLEDDARKIGVKNLLASISSENTGSIEFHEKHGFVECGRFINIGKKFGRTFSVVWMGKELAWPR